VDAPVGSVVAEVKAKLVVHGRIIRDVNIKAE
jgi:hypothetical protein